MVKAKLETKSSGIRGGKYRCKEQGEMICLIDNTGNYIRVDAFEGFDKDYRRRENCHITIKINGMFYEFKNIAALEKQLKKK